MRRLSANEGPTYIYALKNGDENYNMFKLMLNSNLDFKTLRDVESDLNNGTTESFISDIKLLYTLLTKFYLTDIDNIPEDYSEFHSSDASRTCCFETNYAGCLFT